jgi:hypothetical protein
LFLTGATTRVSALSSASDPPFLRGLNAYRSGDFTAAAKAFAEDATRQPSSGTFQNLGNAEWQRGRAGDAIVAWERALWVEPRNRAVRENLRFARKGAQLESPDLAWYEVVSSWLPANWWAWLAGMSLWSAVGAVMLPGLLRRRRRTWHQALAAFCLTAFLLCLPAHLGVFTRSRLGFVLQKETPLRLTPTREAQAVTHLAAGEPARWVRVRGNFVMVRTNRGRGWVEADDIGWLCPVKGGRS